MVSVHKSKNRYKHTVCPGKPEFASKNRPTSFFMIDCRSLTAESVKAEGIFLEVLLCNVSDQSTNDRVSMEDATGMGVGSGGAGGPWSHLDFHTWYRYSR